MARQTRQQQKKEKKANAIKRTKSIQDVIQQNTKLPVFPSPVTKKIQKPETKQIQKKVIKDKKEEKKKTPVKTKVQEKKKKVVKKKKEEEEEEEEEEKMEVEQKPQKKQQKNNIKKTNSSFKDRKFREEEIPNFINMEQLQEGIHEMDMHRNFKERFLGKEGAFSAYKILIGAFECAGSRASTEVEKTAGQELKKRGFHYDIEKDFDKFVTRINDYDIVWLASTKTKRSDDQKSKLIEAMDKFFKAKKSLLLWSDNDPYFQEANIILEKFFNGMKMVGDYQGDKQVVKSETDNLTKGTFDGNHSIGYGLNNLHEGITICHPQNPHPDFKHFAYSTNNEPLVSYAEENENHGRIILDCGYTKFYSNYWEGCGTHQYVSNANVWLTGIPQ